MKKRVLIALGLALLGAMVTSSIALAGPSDSPALQEGEIDDSWAIGFSDESGPFAASVEYPFFGQSSVDWEVGNGPEGSFFDTYDYFISPPQDADPINAPNFPGYIGPQNVCDVDVVYGNPNDTRNCVMTARQINVHFTLSCDYVNASDLVLLYSRYGSENDQIFLDLDGEPFATVTPGAEFGHQEFLFDLGPLSSGEHVVSFVYAGGGVGNGHYIDDISLTASNPVCEEECPPKDGDHNKDWGDHDKNWGGGSWGGGSWGGGSWGGGSWGGSSYGGSWGGSYGGSWGGKSYGSHKALYTGGSHNNNDDPCGCTDDGKDEGPSKNLFTGGSHNNNDPCDDNNNPPPDDGCPDGDKSWGSHKDLFTGGNHNDPCDDGSHDGGGSYGGSWGGSYGGSWGKH